MHGFLVKHDISSSQNILSRWFPTKVLSSITSADSVRTSADDEPPAAMVYRNEMELNRVDCLVWVLHESARSFSVAIQTHELTGSGPELANAWVGVDVHAWHKRTAYQVAVYALLKAAIKVESYLSHKRYNNTSPVSEILSPKIIDLGEFIESQLNKRHPELVQWFKIEELPRIAELFIQLFKKWSVEYAGSGVAGTILAISSCSAVGKLGSGRIACPLFSSSIEDVLIELMDMSRGLVSVDKLHQLAMDAGFEEDFLSHFGKKVLPSKNIEDVEFWVGLVEKKLSLAFHRESVITGKRTFSDKVENSLATLGLFAYLGRETRLFLAEMKIKDLDEQIKNFLSYLECGSLFFYPEFDSLPKYQLFIEVVTDEIRWLDFYAPLKCKFYQEGRRSKQQAIQAEKEIILYTVLTVCYDVFSGFAHFSSSTQQPLDADLLSFLLQSQTLLSVCLEDYWAAYDKSGELLKPERGTSDLTPPVRTNKGSPSSSLILEAQRNPMDLIKREGHQAGSRLSKGASLAGMDPVSVTEGCSAAESKPLHECLLRESTVKLISASHDIWMGTHLLFIDVMDSLGLLMKQLRGYKVTKRERRKIKRTLADIANLIPVTILMLIPVSAVGHAAMLAAIKKYMPSLIPSPYSSERLNLMKQLKRTKKMEVQSRANFEDMAQLTETTKGNK